ncbi:carbon-phosphorus lyase complex accessory protein [Vibrio nigripulchritudo SOn1]|uniref:Carbon-phosphorus lyase complex accessory protein n=2 Tax=Vibrio nigripulchritudo TaxID=28173 RepID=A0AAV2VT98_9VIBR|nr:carbon-phosphorus lyase complex accessory protein [Vibrio nigripulchritudo SOn1]
MAKGNASMQLTLLGTGNTGHVPVYGCDCIACDRAREDHAFRRGKTSAYIEHNGKTLLLDANHPHLLERFPAGSIDTILLTHFHMDHVQSLFDLRWGKGQPIPVLSPPDKYGCDDLYKHPGLLDFQALKAFEPFEWEGITITPVPLSHSKPCFGYLFEWQGKTFAYLTDTVGLPKYTHAFLKDKPLDLVLIDCNHPPMPDSPPRNHNDILLAQSIKQQLTVSKLGLIHISHELDCWAMENSNQFSSSFFLAKDNQSFHL